MNQKQKNILFTVIFALVLFNAAVACVSLFVNMIGTIEFLAGGGNRVLFSFLANLFCFPVAGAAVVFIVMSLFCVRPKIKKTSVILQVIAMGLLALFFIISVFVGYMGNLLTLCFMFAVLFAMNKYAANLWKDPTEDAGGQPSAESTMDDEG